MEVKNKRDVPKIRFNIYRKKWKKKKFKDFTKLSQGLQIAISDRFTEDAETRHFYITNEFLNPNSRKIYYIESPSENVICSSNDIKEAIIQIPTIEEQQAIGFYFSSLDQLITSYQEKITQLETLKKKLLQDMFI